MFNSGIKNLLTFFILIVNIYANMEVLFHLRAEEEYWNLKISVQNKFDLLFKEFTDRKRLSKENFKKIVNSDLFEFRARQRGDIFRAIGGFIKPNFVIVLIFQKKTNKLPMKEFEKAIKRYRQLL